MGSGVHPQLAHVSSAEGISSPNGLRAGRRPINSTTCELHLLRSRDWQLRTDGGRGQAEGLRRARRSFPFGVLGRAKMAGEGEGFVKILRPKIR